MPYAELPLMNLTGEWSAIPAEQALVKRLVAGMPAAPGPGADLYTRWDTAMDTLVHIHTVIYDNRAAMFEGRTFITDETGKIMLVTVLSAIVDTLHDCERYAAALRAREPRAETLAAKWLDRYEPEIAQLRRFLVEAAGEA